MKRYVRKKVVHDSSYLPPVSFTSQKGSKTEDIKRKSKRNKTLLSAQGSLQEVKTEDNRQDESPAKRTVEPQQTEELLDNVKVELKENKEENKMSVSQLPMQVDGLDAEQKPKALNIASKKIKRSRRKLRKEPEWDSSSVV